MIPIRSTNKKSYTYLQYELFYQVPTQVSITTEKVVTPEKLLLVEKNGGDKIQQKRQVEKQNRSGSIHRIRSEESQ